MIDAMIYSVMRLKTYTEKEKFVKMGRYYLHDMEPSKGQPQTLTAQPRRAMNAIITKFLGLKTLEACNKKQVRSAELNDTPSNWGRSEPPTGYIFPRCILIGK
jgi:hypothetical protein